MALAHENYTNPHQDSSLEKLDSLIDLLVELQASSASEKLTEVNPPMDAKAEELPADNLPILLKQNEPNNYPKIQSKEEKTLVTKTEISTPKDKNVTSKQEQENSSKKPSLYDLESLESADTLSTLAVLQTLLSGSQPTPKQPPEPPPTQHTALSRSGLSDTDLGSLRQQVEILANKLETIEKQVYEPTDLINPLIPLITELLRLKSNASREELAAALMPIIDDVIVQRTQQDRQAMSNAIATLIPIAIEQQIKNSPEEIAKAIAPEIGAAIEEQIRLERNAISKALAPEMGKAIKAQIELERESMVDALYPVIGSTISKYMGEAIRSINQQVESALTPEGIQRKIRAKMLGVSEAELILREAMPLVVRAIFLIDAASGLIIAEVQPSEANRLESDLIAGMLTAIRSFANDCFARAGSVSELDQIDYGNSRIILEFAGYCYLAVIVQGEPSKEFIQRTRDQLAFITQHYGSAIEAFDGDPATVPPAIYNRLETLINDFQSDRHSKPPTALLFLVVIILSIFLVPWGIWQYRSTLNQRIQDKIALALLSSPELSVYRIVPEVRRDRVTLRGRVPTEYLRSKAEAVTQLEAPNRQLINRIISINVPPDPELVAAEIQRLTSVLNQPGNMLIASRYDGEQVRVEGILFDSQDSQLIVEAFEQIPGVRKVVTTFNLEEDILNSRIYFELGSTQPKAEDITNKLIPVRNLLQQNSNLQLKIIGHSDAIGDTADRRKIANQRAEAIQRILISQGISSERLQTIGVLEFPPNVTSSSPLQLSRCVRFELVLVSNPK